MINIAQSAPDKFAIATECPSCGASLDFGEGSNAIRCSHCGVHLLVTGRRQVLSYFIPPKLEASEALSMARFAQSPSGGSVSLAEPRLYFVPYYRLTASEFRWEKVRPSPRDRHGLEEFVGEVRSLFGRLTLVASGLINPAEEQIEFGDRSIEKSFLACDAPELGVYSLGVRPGVLKLELFRKAELEKRGRIVGIDLAADQAMERALKSPGNGAVVHREVVGRVLSVVYFPFWVVGTARNGISLASIVDAVSGQVVKPDAGTELLAQLDQATGSEGRALGFRPLMCPNCGWDLPVRPDDVIFVCSGCTRAWEIVGDRLDEIPVEVVELPNGVRRDAVKYLPVWVIGSQGDSCDRYFVPAFRYRLKVIKDLATRLTRRKPSYSVTRGESLELHGCALDVDDAIALAGFVAAGLRRDLAARRPKAMPETWTRGSARLTWFPFEADSYSLRDPFTGSSLPKQSLS